MGQYIFDEMSYCDIERLEYCTEKLYICSDSSIIHNFNIENQLHSCPHGMIRFALRQEFRPYRNDWCYLTRFVLH